MFFQSNELIAIVIPNQQQRLMLEKRFQISNSEEFITFSEWCEKSPLSANLVATMIQMFVQPKHKQVRLFQNIPIADILTYVKTSHNFYNSYYIFRFEQLIDKSINTYDERPSILRIKRSIEKFIKLFRAHIIWEETQPIPYIEFLSLQDRNSICSIEECYAIIAKNNLIDSASHDEKEHLLLQKIIQQIRSFCAKNRYDVQLNYYYKLLCQFQQDLQIHEFVEDKILSPKAQEIEQTLAQLIDQRSLLN